MNMAVIFFFFKEIKDYFHTYPQLPAQFRPKPGFQIILTRIFQESILQLANG